MDTDSFTFLKEMLLKRTERIQALKKAADIYEVYKKGKLIKQ